MTTVRRDLAQLNFEALLLARTALKENKMLAMHQFRLDEAQAQTLVGMTLDRMKQIAGSGQIMFSFIPDQHIQEEVPPLFRVVLAGR